MVPYKERKSKKKKKKKDSLSNPSDINPFPDGIHEKISPKNPGSWGDTCWSQVA